MSQNLTRRTALTLGAAALAVPALASEKRRVLFIGNSFTAEHDVPSLFKNIAESLGYPVEIDAVLQNGAFLADHAPGRASRIRLITDRNPDIVVLQEHSLAAFKPKEGARSFKAIVDYRFSGKHMIYFAPWPRRSGHKLYSQDGMPQSPGEMVDRSEAHLRQAAWFDMSLASGPVARIGRAWLLAEGITLHRGDRYHANLSGAWLAALMLVRTAGFTSSAPPFVPDGMSTTTAKRLYQIARMVAP